MSRNLAILIAGFVLLPASAGAQDVYGPSLETDGGNIDAPLTEVRANPCETEAQEDGVILVCRELEDQERYRSPIPRETQSDRVIIPGLTDPPCWVTNPGSVGTTNCVRFGWAPEPAIMVDLSAFPEPLSSAEAAQVTEVEEEPNRERPATGERVRIDLTGED